MVQWVIKLSQFDIKYKPQTAIKAQVLANFIVEFTLSDPAPRAEYWTIYADGSSVTGLGREGVIISSFEKYNLKYGVQLQFPATHNEAKFEAILISLRVAKALKAKNLKLKTDSKLVVGQITSEYETKEERMKRYLKLTNYLISYFDDVRLE